MARKLTVTQTRIAAGSCHVDMTRPWYCPVDITGLGVWTDDFGQRFGLWDTRNEAEPTRTGHRIKANRIRKQNH